MIKVLLRSNIFEYANKEFEYDYVPKRTLFEYLSQGQPNDPIDKLFKVLNTKQRHLIKTGAVKFLLNLHVIDPPEKIKTIIPKDGDTLTILLVPKDFVSIFLVPLLISLALSAASMAISYLLMPKPSPPSTSSDAEIKDSPTYNWEGPTTSYALGRAVPIIYGTHMTGGSYVNALVEGLPYGYENSWGSPGDRPRMWGRKSSGLYSTNYDVNPGTILTDPAVMAWWNSDEPTGNSDFAYFSNLYSSTNPFAIDYPNLNPNVNHMYATSMRGLCKVVQVDKGAGNKVWIIGWKVLARLLTYDFTPNRIAPATIINNWTKLSMGGGKYLRDNIFAHPDWAWPAFQIWDFDGQREIVFPYPYWNSSTMASVFPEAAALQAAGGLEEGERIWAELILETADVLLFESGDNNIGPVSLGVCPFMSGVEYKHYGLANQKDLENKTYSLADGLRMLVAISSGEVCSIGNIAGLGADSNIVKEIDIRLNDIPVGDLFTYPDVAGYTSPIEIQASRGANYPVTRFAEDQDSYANLFNKKLLNSSSFDWLVVTKAEEGSWFRHDTSTVCSAMDVVLNFKKGMYEWHQEDGKFYPIGDYTGTEDSNSFRAFNFYIEYYPVGNPGAIKYWTAEGGGIVSPDGEPVPFTLIDQREEAFKLTIRIGNDKNPLPANNYHINIYRELDGFSGEIINPNNPDNAIYIYDDFWISKVSEYGFEMMRYPNTAILGLRILPTDKISGAAPNISTLVEGKYIKVPILRRGDLSIVPLQRSYTTYDSDTGVWTWKERIGIADPDVNETLSISTEEYIWQFTNNPAFIIYDLLTTQDLYPYIPESVIVWQDFINAAAFCWEMLSVGALTGKQERRYECNIVLDGEVDASNILNQISNMYRLKILWVGNRLRLKILKPESPSQKFNNANIIPDSYQESYQQFGKVLNTLEVSFYNEENYFKQEVMQITTKDAEASKQKLVKQTYSLIGTTKLSQAMRISQYLLAYAAVTDKAIKFKTTMQGLACFPGDVVRIQHETMSYGYSGHLRIDPVAGTYYLDKEIYMPANKAGDYRFEVQKASTREWGTDTVTWAIVDAPHTFDSISGVTLLDADAVPVVVSEGDAWQLVPMSGEIAYTKDVRVSQITTDVDKNECTIEAEPYIETIYSEDPLQIIKPYVPRPPPPQDRLPPDVENLTLTQIQDTCNINVNYNAPENNIVTYFNSVIESVTVDSLLYTIYYDEEVNDSQLLTALDVDIYSSIGTYKGSMSIGPLDTVENYFVGRPSGVEFIPVAGDFVRQERAVTGQSIHHTNIYLSETGSGFSLHGTDYSGGSGYIINLPESYTGRTIWVRVQAVSPQGALSPNPPTASIRLTTDKCLPSPSHLSMCSVGDGQSTFIGCDVCISWSEVSSFQGAGLGETIEAEDRADLTGDFRITGYTIWIYNNADTAAPRLLRSLTGFTNIEYHYDHNTNKEDQYRYSGIEGKGYRDLKFEVYQEDTFGNVSCNPAIIQLSNAAPSMVGYTPFVRVVEQTIFVDWTGFINDPSQMPEDVLGWEVWYGTSPSNMTFIDVPDNSQGNVMLSGLSTGNYEVYVVPYDCFGTGTPRTAYASESAYTIIEGPTLPTYVPENPEGMAANLTITNFTDQGTHYLIECTNSLQYYGFDQAVTSEGVYAASTFTYNYIYYNSTPGDDYCYVTASNLNTQNLITAIWWDTDRWYIKFPAPLNDTLTSYGYTEAQGEPQIGQTFSINVWAGLSYEEGGGIWGGGLGSTLYMRWFAPNLSSTVQRLSHYLFNIRNNDSGITAKQHPVGVDKELADNGYYTEAVENLPAANSLSLSAVLWSNSGDQSDLLMVGTVYVVVEVLSDTPLVDASFTAVADTEGRNIQFVINNWEGIWNLSQVKHFEFFVHPGHYTFSTDTWSAPTVFETDFIAGTYEAKPYEEEEFEEESRDKLRAKIDNGYLHVYVGASDAPVWQWTNEICTNEGGLCTYYNAGEDICDAGFTTQYQNYNCPYGLSQDGIEDPITYCTYLSGSTDCGRTVDTVHYNVYYVAVAVRHKTGMLQFLTYTDPDGIETGDYVAQATLDLISWMHISNASITTAKIGDLAVNNAKIRNLAASKVWIGDPANEAGLPFTLHCAYDGGVHCEFWGECIEGEDGCPHMMFNPVTGIGCPTAIAQIELSPGVYGPHPNCNYMPSEFAITRIFDLYENPLSNRMYTYINGGFIMTDTIKARSIQVGALDYIIDLEAYQVYVKTIVDTQVTVKWHKGGEEGSDGHVSFVDGITGFMIAPGEKTFADADFPDGTEGNKVKIHIAYFDYINTENGSQVTLLFQEQVLEGPEHATDWDINSGFTRMKYYGNLPLFAVVIVNNPGSRDPEDGGGDVVLSGITPLTAEDVINSTRGQFNVNIVWAKGTAGTFIRNNDITTGVVHNATWTSFIDMRHYSSYDAGVSYKGHGRMAIDAPSSLYERSVSSAYGDPYGVEWWNYLVNYPDTYGTDTKFIIGRPYIDGFENALIESGFIFTEGDEREEAEWMGDQGYLWFYRTYEDETGNPKIPPTWVGHLEIGGRLRVKNLMTYRETLVGLEYTETMIDPEGDPEDPANLTWIRTSAPGLHIYDIQDYITNGGAPINLATLGGDTPVTVLGAQTSAHYFNTNTSGEESHNYTVCIDVDGQAPVPAFYSNEDPESPASLWEGYASLLIIPALPHSYHTTGILIRSGATEEEQWAPGTGLRIIGNFMSSAIYAELIRSGAVGPNNLTAVQGVVASTITGGGINLKGGDFAVNETGIGAISTVTGVLASVTIDAIVSQEGCGLKAYIDAGGTTEDTRDNCAGLIINCNENMYMSPHAYIAHIRFVDLIPAGSHPTNAYGQVGDLIAGERNIWYKTTQADVFGNYWRALGYSPLV